MADASCHDLLCKKLIEFERVMRDTHRRVGIVRWKAGQSEDQALTNGISPEFDEFLTFFGQRVRLKGWKGFRGGLDVQNDETGEWSVFAAHDNFRFMAHVSTLLPATAVGDAHPVERKRHIGNDVVVIVFWEGPGSFDVSHYRSQPTQVFLVVEKVDTEGAPPLPRYRVGVICRSGVQSFAPAVPFPSVFSADDAFRKWLFTKLINGERAARSTRSFAIKLTSTRKILLKKLVMDVESLLQEPLCLRSPFEYAKLIAPSGAQLCKSIASFDGVAPSHLSFKKGETIILYCRASAEWWNGGIGSRRGDFPAARVVALVVTDAEIAASILEEQHVQKSQRRVRVPRVRCESLPWMHSSKEAKRTPENE